MMLKVQTPLLLRPLSSQEVPLARCYVCKANTGNAQRTSPSGDVPDVSGMVTFSHDYISYKIFG